MMTPDEQATTTPTPPSPLPVSCGHSAVTPSVFNRIVGGQEAREHSYPWMAAVMVKFWLRADTVVYGGPLCGASIVTTRCLVTAAHCVVDTNLPASRLVVAVGQHTISPILAGSWNTSTSGQLDDDTQRKLIYDVVRVRVNENYVQSTKENDLAILVTADEMVFDDWVGPICLPSDGGHQNDDEDDDDDMRQKNCYATGWGTTSPGGRQSDVLRQVELPLIDTAECAVLYRSGLITTNKLCAGYIDTGGRDTCQGDSGGPLACFQIEATDIVDAINATLFTPMVEVDDNSTDWTTTKPNSSVSDNSTTSDVRDEDFIERNEDDSGGSVDDDSLPSDGASSNPRGGARSNSMRWTLYGVTSFGIGCAEPRLPGVYTRVSQYVSWIRNHVTVPTTIDARSSAAGRKSRRQSNRTRRMRTGGIVRPWSRT